jgi:hypothetical protein
MNSRKLVSRILHSPTLKQPRIALLDPPLLDRGSLHVVVLDRYAESCITEDSSSIHRRMLTSPHKESNHKTGLTLGQFAARKETNNREVF